MTHRHLLLLAAAALTAPVLPAANLTWDSGGSSPTAPVDGSGVWNTSSANWTDGTTSRAWIDANNDTAVFGGVSGTPGTVTLASAVSVGGLTFNVAGYTLSGASITLAPTSTITASADAVIGSNLAVASGAVVNKNGAGTLTFSGLVTGGGAYTLNVNAGKISLTNTGYNALGNGRPDIVLAAGATLSADASSGNAFNIRSLTLNGGTLTSGQEAANDGGYGNFLLNGNVAVGGNSLSTISSKTLSLNGVARTFNVADSVSGSDTDLLVSAIVMSGSLVKEGAGTMTLSSASANTYAGDTVVNAGVLQIAAGSGYGGLSSSGAIVVNNGGTLRTTGTNAISGNAVTVNAGGMFTVDANDVVTMGNTTLAGGTLSGAGSNGYGNYFFNDRTITHTGDVASTINATGGIGVNGTITFAIADGAAGDDLTVTAPILEPEGATVLVKNGAGRLRLSGVSSYTGGTHINQGVIATGNIAALGTGAVTLTGGSLVVDAENLSGIDSLALNAGSLDTRAGNLVTAGNFTLTGGVWLVGGAADGLTADSFSLTGGTIDLSLLSGSAKTTSGYSLISGTGTSSDVTFIGGNAGYAYTIDVNGDLLVSAIPEPGTYGFVAIGAFGVAAIRRRKKRASR